GGRPTKPCATPPCPCSRPRSCPTSSASSKRPPIRSRCGRRGDVARPPPSAGCGRARSSTPTRPRSPRPCDASSRPRGHAFVEQGEASCVEQREHPLDPLRTAAERVGNVAALAPSIGLHELPDQANLRRAPLDGAARRQLT